MPISIQCTECDKKLKAPDTAAGKKIRCPGCKSLVAVPDVEEAKPEDDLVEDEESRITEKPKRKAPLKSRNDDSYDTYEDDEDEEEERERRRRRKRRRRDFDDDYDDRPRRPKESHRAVIILVLGCAAIFFCWFPLICWVLAAFAENMARADLKKMVEGKMDRSGRGLTQAGQIVAYVAAVLGIFGCVINGYLLRRGV